MRKWRKVLLQFVRWPARRNEMDFVKIKSPVGGPRHGKVPRVNRIERASEKRDAARMMLCGGALGLRGGQYASRELMTCIFS
jgi:hypothetical protein